MFGACEICQKWRELEKHHVYGAGKRMVSERYGAVVFICRECHDDLHHHHPSQYLWLKKDWQRRLMTEHEWDVYDFIRVFGRSYL